MKGYSQIVGGSGMKRFLIYRRVSFSMGTWTHARLVVSRVPYVFEHAWCMASLSLIGKPTSMEST